MLITSADHFAVFLGVSVFLVNRQSLEACGTVGQAAQPGRPTEKHSSSTVYSET